jgi:5-methylcytosine-specific restriction enzyme A
MNDETTDRIRGILQTRTGIDAHVSLSKFNGRESIVAVLSAYTSQGGPVFTLSPSGLRRHKVSFRFGNYSKPCICQINQFANKEQHILARALIDEIRTSCDVKVHEINKEGEWVISEDFNIVATRGGIQNQYDLHEIMKTVEKVLAPLIGAIVELIGHDDVSNSCNPETGAEEGARNYYFLSRYERNPRNRMLCLQIHGEVCAVCDYDPRSDYGDHHGDILEVHHIVPLSSLTQPNTYNPRDDLIPLCPNCHRAIHRQTPVPHYKEFRDTIKES